MGSGKIGAFATAGGLDLASRTSTGGSGNNGLLLSSCGLTSTSFKVFSNEFEVGSTEGLGCTSWPGVTNLTDVSTWLEMDDPRLEGID